MDFANDDTRLPYGTSWKWNPYQIPSCEDIDKVRNELSLPPYNIKLTGRTTEDDCLELATRWPKSATERWTFEDQIASGSFGSIYTACTGTGEERCNYVAKMSSDPENPSAVRRMYELEMYVLGEYGGYIAPRLFDGYTYVSPFLSSADSGYVVQNPVYVIVMEKFEGNLTYYLSNPSLSQEDRMDVIRKAVQRVRDLNSHMILHRDMKTDNIVYGHSGKEIEVRLIDFGHSYVPDTQFKDTWLTGSNWTGGYPPNSYKENPAYDIECLQRSLKLHCKIVVDLRKM